MITKLEGTLESSFASVDVGRLPLIVQTVKSLTPTLDQTQEHVDLAEYVMQNSTGPLYLISDLSAMKWVSIRSIIDLGKGMYQIDKRHPNRIQLHAFVNPSRAIRIFIPIFNLFARLEGKQISTDTMAEAIDWISLETGVPFYE